MACITHKDICNDLFAGCDGITSLVLPADITIGNSAFACEFTGGMGHRGKSVMEGGNMRKWLI